MAGFELGTFSIGSLIGLLFGAFLGHSLAIRRGKSLAKHNAAIEFKKVVVPALDELENGGNQFKIIQGAFDSHYKAALIYSAYLNTRELKSFKSALTDYKRWQNTVYGRSTEEILYDTNDQEYLREKKINPISLINELLKYANT